MHDEQQLGLLIVHLGSDDTVDSCRIEGGGYTLTLFEGGSDFQVREVEKLSEVGLYPACSVLVLDLFKNNASSTRLQERDARDRHEW